MVGLSPSSCHLFKKQQHPQLKAIFWLVSSEKQARVASLVSNQKVWTYKATILPGTPCLLPAIYLVHSTSPLHLSLFPFPKPPFKGDDFCLFLKMQFPKLEVPSLLILIVLYHLTHW